MRRRLVALTVLSIVLAGCGGDGGQDGDASAAPSVTGAVEQLEVTSSAFEDGGSIPVEHTCDGPDTLPPLSWSAPPSEAASIAVVVEDPDAPGGTFTHLAVAGLAPAAGGLGGELPADVTVGANGFGQAGWGGPCPPPDDGPHTYRFRVVALSADPGLESGFSPGNLADAAEGTVVAEGTLTGTFDR